MAKKINKQIDLTVKVVIISFLLTCLLTISNTYLALKVGLLTAASIPAAILSMGLMKFFRSSTIYEHNLVQTAASSGEAIAGGIGYTVPALVIIGFAHGFNYIDTALLGIIGGIMGVLFSAIIRKPLLEDKTLRFPEGQAISEVLKLKESKALGFSQMIIGGVSAAIVEFLQSTQAMFVSGLKFVGIGGSLIGAGIGLSPALIGAGYIVGARVGLSLLLGAVISYLIILPLLSHGAVLPHAGHLMSLYNQSFGLNMRYVGVGGMLLAALVTLLQLLKPLYHNVSKTLRALGKSHFLPVHEQDLSGKTILFGLLAMVVLLSFVFFHLFNLQALGFGPYAAYMGVGLGIVFVLLVGFVVAIVCGYFSGLVGVSASPGSAALIGALILAALLVHSLLLACHITLSQHVMLIGEVITILVVSVVMQIACISNDTLQDLKVGQLIGASPRKQQIMLIFGVVVASLLVPLIMEVLYKAYGIAGAMPHPGMNPATEMAAPPAAIMAALTGAIFQGAIPLKMLGIGALAMVLVMGLQSLVLSKIKKSSLKISYIGVGIGMYLALPNSIPLVIGALLSYFLGRRLLSEVSKQKKILLACGMVAGAALMDVVLAIPVAINPEGQALSFHIPIVFYVILSVLGLGALLVNFLRGLR